jgi:hypothetical protein
MRHFTDRAFEADSELSIAKSSSLPDLKYAIYMWLFDIVKYGKAT